MRNNKFNKSEYGKKVTYLIDKIGLDNKDLAEVIVGRIDLNKQYYIKKVNEDDFIRECYRERNLTKELFEMVDVMPVEGYVDFGFKEGESIVKDVGEVECIAIVKTKIQYKVFEDAGEYNTSRVINELIIKEE